MDDGMLLRTTTISGGGGCKAFANMGRLSARCDGRAGATGARWCDGRAEVRRVGATNATKMRRRTKLMRQHLEVIRYICALKQILASRLARLFNGHITIVWGSALRLYAPIIITLPCVYIWECKAHFTTTTSHLFLRQEQG